MQLKLKRSQRETGVLSTNVIFCLDARVEFTREEQHSVTRYKLANQVIYNSEASKRLLDKSAAQQDGSTLGSLKSLATLAMVGLKLNISIASLQRGQHVECKSLDELLGAEDAIMTACQNLRGYLDTAASFDGREVLVDFNDNEPKIIAQAVGPSPQLISPAPLPPAPISPPPAALPPPIVEVEFTSIPPAEATSAAHTAGGEPPELGLFDGLPFDIHDQKTQQRIVLVAIALLMLIAWIVG